MKIKLSSLVLLKEFMDSKSADKLGARQIEILQKILDTLEGMDISIDQLTALIAGTDPLSLQIGQDTYGRLAPMRPKRGTPPPPETPKAANEGWSDHNKTKSLTENWRKFIEEEAAPTDYGYKGSKSKEEREDISKAMKKRLAKQADAARQKGKQEEPLEDPSTPTASSLTPQDQKQQGRILKDLLSKEYVTFVNDLQSRIKDGKFREFLNMGIEDGDLEDDKVGISEIDIPVANLRPTQSQIGLADSLGWVAKNKPSQAGETATADVANVGGRIITANGKYIVDGHHRWSQVFLLNPNASIPAINFEIKGNPSAKSVLKLAQLAIAAVDRVVPGVDADSESDIFATKGNVDVIKKRLNDTVSDAMAQSLMDAWGLSSREEVIEKITNNAVALYKRGTHNPDVLRKFMPQLDKISDPSKKITKLKIGDINYNLQERVIKKMIKEEYLKLKRRLGK